MKVVIEKKPVRELWEWETWYAWRPVFTRLRNRKTTLVWLEEIDRMWGGHSTGWIYKLKEDDE